MAVVSVRNARSIDFAKGNYRAGYSIRPGTQRFWGVSQAGRARTRCGVNYGSPGSGGVLFGSLRSALACSKA